MLDVSLLLPFGQGCRVQGRVSRYRVGVVSGKGTSGEFALSHASLGINKSLGFLPYQDGPLLDLDKRKIWALVIYFSLLYPISGYVH